MPGRVFLSTPVAEVARILGVAADADLDEPPRRNIAPGQEVLALNTDGLVRMRWGLIPVGRVNARGRPVLENIVNARGETLFGKSAFAGTGRAIVPVDGWYEWTGKTGRKTAWRITPVSGGLLFFAAITDVWTAPGGRQVPQLATVTCDPSADVKPIHHRMAVILRPDDIPLWLSGSGAAVMPLIRPWPDGSLVVEKATDVDWSRA